MQLTNWRNNSSAILIGLLGFFPALIGAFALVSYGLDRNDYHFGTEVGGYMYTTSYHYVGTNFVLIVLFLAILGLRRLTYKVFAVALQAMILVLTVSDVH